MRDDVRKEVDLNMSTLDLITIMSEGNPGAVSVLTQILNQSDIGFLLILSLDDMNIRGSQIWIGYKDYCQKDLKRFIEAIQKRDEQMIRCINNVGGKGNHEHKAVTNGASSDSRGFLDEDKITGKSW